MSNVQALNFKKELAEAEAVAAQRREAWENAPELSADDILAGIKRELRFVAVESFGKVYYYHPMSVAEHLALQDKIAGGLTTAGAMVQAIIDHARNADGSLKFKPEHAPALLDAPPAAVARLASAVVSSLRFTVVSGEKK